MDEMMKDKLSNAKIQMMQASETLSYYWTLGNIEYEEMKIYKDGRMNKGKLIEWENQKEE
jgi:hypothetical protein